MKSSAFLCVLFLSLGLMAETATNSVPAALADFEAKTFVLKYAKADEVADSLNRLCRQLGLNEAAVAFPKSHTVVVAAPPKAIAACEKIVQNVDRKPKQVYIEARFLDVLVADLENLGIDWSMLNSIGVSGSFSAGVGGARLPDGTSYSQNGAGENATGKGLTVGDAGGMTHSGYYQGTLNSTQLSLLLNAFRVNNDNRMIANPRVVVSSGKRATVDISTKRPNVTITAKRTISDGSDSMDVDAKLQVVPGKDKLMFADESFFWWGIGLLVEPYVAEDGVITARIVPNVSDLSDYTMQPEGPFVVASTGNVDMPVSKFPIIDVKRIETEFSLKSGETAVIGGLSRTELQEMETGIPYLCKIPVIGPYLFGSTKKVRQQREIVVLVTMGLVDPEEPNKSAGLPKNAFITREYVNGNKKEPGDLSDEELRELYHQDKKPNASETEKD